MGRETQCVSKGPAIQELTRWLSEYPPSILAEPVQPNGSGEVMVQAVVADLLRSLGMSVIEERELKSFAYSSASQINKERNRLRMVLIGCWLGSSSALTPHLSPQQMLGWLSSGLDELAKLIKAESLVNDEQRREEFARLMLSRLEVLPSGESKKEAENRLDALDTVKRDAVVREARAAEERARRLREEMVRKEAERRAASTYGYE